jgi:uncharacterized membrane protein
VQVALRRAAVFLVLGLLLYLASFVTTEDLQRLLRGVAWISWALAVVFGLVAVGFRRQGSRDDAR